MTILTTIMRTTATLRMEDTVTTARDFFTETFASTLPVLDGGDRVVGVVTERDLGDGSRKLSELIQDKFLTAGPLDAITDIEGKLTGAGPIVVVDDRGIYLGIIERPDLMRKS